MLSLPEKCGVRHISTTPMLITFLAVRLKVKKEGKGRYSSSWEPHLRATGRHLPYGITQCYLPSDTSKRAPRNPNHAGWYSIYLPRRDGRLSWPSWLDSAPAGSRTSDLSITSPTPNRCTTGSAAIRSTSGLFSDSNASCWWWCRLWSKNGEWESAERLHWVRISGHPCCMAVARRSAKRWTVSLFSDRRLQTLVTHISSLLAVRSILCSIQPAF